MQILVGTNNAGKFIEISEVLQNLDIELLKPQDIGIKTDPEETGATFQENSELKARQFFKSAQLPTIADDSGIIVEAIQDELGVHTRRWGAGAMATDQEWIDFFLERMQKEDNKAARFVCVLSYIDTNEVLHQFEGTCEGVITDELEAEFLPGLPISGCFKPNGHEAVFSALSIEQKNSTSHRGRAVQQLADYLSK